jgi:hypothetical protein
MAILTNRASFTDDNVADMPIAAPNRLRTLLQSIDLADRWRPCDERDRGLWLRGDAIRRGRFVVPAEI